MPANHSPHCITRAWLTLAALGIPVVPDVKMQERAVVDGDLAQLPGFEWPGREAFDLLV